MTHDIRGNWCLVKIKGVKNQQIALRSELNKITAEYTITCTGSYDELEKVVYAQLEKKSRDFNSSLQ